MEAELKASLLQNMEKLEQRRLSLQRELLMRSMEKGSVRSAVVVPSREDKNMSKHKKRRL